MIPHDLLEKYNLPEDQVADAIEKAISRTLSAMFDLDILVRLDDRLEIYALSKSFLDTDPRPIDPRGLSRQVRRQIRYQIERELEKRQAIHEGNLLRSLRGQIVKGEIRQVSSSGDVAVVLEVEDHFRNVAITGLCPFRHVPPKERGTFKPGVVRSFLVTSVLPVQQKDRYKVQIRLSRTSKTLPKLLLREETGVKGIRCTRRIAGAFSEIESPQFLPKTAIRKVADELGERIIVRVVLPEKKTA
ncbi:hypothetical protein EDC39_11214 [Geothermobacter ehrlichii]|uniref:S1 motif domain-containing protein n=1 Tax=Geothermobacter ehrlichii TaxID=213224 RepID=A0A5D3WHC2_9BACT|nr:hypothetical protein [Geothermobacter ehrlichii]TYO96726.1 hypothetical protein EDC39_11214 [Geothermobacter ehrlichii]